MARILPLFIFSGVVAIVSGACLGATYEKVDALGGGGGGDGIGGAEECSGVVGLIPEVCEVDYLDDPNNCCEQGRICEGGVCAGGKCAPEQFVTTPPGGDAIGVVRVGAFLVWTTGYGTEVRKALVEGDPGTAGAQLALDGSGSAGALATDGAAVFWTEIEGSDVWRADPASFDGNVVNVGYTGNEFHGGDSRISVHGDYIYWASERSCAGDPVVCDLPGAVWRSLKDEPATNDPDEQIYFGGNPVAVAADDDWVFFTDSPDSLMGSVYRLAIGDIGDPNVTPDTVALESEGLSDIAIHNGRVYWIDGSQIWASALDPLDPLPIGQGPNSSGGWGLAFDDIFVYWTVYNGGDVWRATLSGGASQQVAVNANSEGLGIAADCYTIYFGSRTPGSSSIHRVTK